jgi:hypothetical protein
MKSFLNAVLPLPEDRVITELTYLNPQTTPAIPVLKHTIADVHCRDNHGREFIVEIQIEWTDSFKQRLLFESGQALVKQLCLLWLRFLREINEKTKYVSEELLNVPEIKEAVQLAEEAAYSEGELLAYESYWNAVSTEKTLMVGRYLEGKLETSLEIANTMLHNQYSPEEVAKITMLPLETIGTLKK